MSVFIWVPSYGSSVATKPSVHVTQFGDGYEVRTAHGINNNRRKWEVSFSRPNGIADAIEAFLVSAGALESFEWAPPHGGAGKWVCREWAVLPTGPYTRTITATFLEIFE